MKPPFTVQTPFFIPRWRRLFAVAATLGWAGVETVFGSEFWATAMIIVAAYLMHQFFVAFDAEALKREQELKDD